jgi:hypothetical protein
VFDQLTARFDARDLQGSIQQVFIEYDVGADTGIVHTALP